MHEAICGFVAEQMHDPILEEIVAIRLPKTLNQLRMSAWVAAG